MCREVKHKHVNLGQSKSEECEKGMDKVSLTTLLKNPEVFSQTLRVKLRNGKTGYVMRYILNSAVGRVGYQPFG